MDLDACTCWLTIFMSSLAMLLNISKKRTHICELVKEVSGLICAMFSS